MGLLDDPQAALRGATALLDAVGDKPIGDPAAIRACSVRVRNLAGEVFAVGNSTASVPNSVAWVGPGADRLRSHAGNTAAEARSAALELGEIADHLEREAKRVHDEQTLRRLDPVELRASIAELVAPAGG